VRAVSRKPWGTRGGGNNGVCIGSTGTGGSSIIRGVVTLQVHLAFYCTRRRFQRIELLLLAQLALARRRDHHLQKRPRTSRLVRHIQALLLQQVYLLRQQQVLI
jgi:hypothetical protein